MAKPPVLETVVQLSYRPSETKAPWGRDTCEKYEDAVKDRGYAFENCRVERNVQLKFEKGRPDILKEVRKVDRIVSASARKRDTKFWLHLSDDVLALSLLREGSDHPGYHELSEEFLILHELYCDLFKPQGINSAKLIYVDLLEIPASQSADEIKDYLRILPDIPAGFPASLRQFNLDVLMETDCPDDKLTLKILQDAGLQDGVRRFRLQWDYAISLAGNSESLASETISYPKMALASADLPSSAQGASAHYKAPYALHASAPQNDPRYTESYCLSDTIYFTEITPPFVDAPTYQLKKSMPFVNQFHTSIHKWKFGNPDVSEYYGEGNTPIEARSNWALEIHSRFQYLLALLPHQMQVEDYSQWRLFENSIDIATYRFETPVRMREVGRFARRRGTIIGIKWDDGRIESINAAVNKVPSDFLGLPPGTLFEAVTLREWQNARLIGITDWERRRPFTEMQLAKARKALPVRSLEQLPSAPADLWGGLRDESSSSSVS
ncbi:MAG: TIGR04255 family protein [Candidatus Sumerlaeota bacterium]|nr:TIGR04255 family protein [Candidatus Sumerlaeota bacterium]